MSLVVLCDFDGTITRIDTAEFTLSKFAKGDWISFEKQLEEGRISLEECLERQFSLVVASPHEILVEVQKVVDFRPNFEELIAYCEDNSISLIVVSAGLDFLINHFLKLNGWKDHVKTYTGKTRFTDDGVRFTFPRLFDVTSANFKQDLVRQCKAKGKIVAYIGDGSGDYDAAKEADFVFAVKGSKLARLCEEHEVPCQRINDFKDVIEIIKDST